MAGRAAGCLWLGLQAAACGGEPAPRALDADEVRLLEPAELLARYPAGPEDSLIEGALALRLAGGEAFVLDGTAGRVLRLGADGSLRAVIGRPGPGPGELDGPAALQLAAGHVWVSHRRGVARYRPDGRPAGDLRTPYPPANFLVTREGRLWVPALSPGALLVEVGARGDTAAVGLRGTLPEALAARPLERVRWLGFLLAEAGSEVLLLQNRHGGDFALWSARQAEDGSLGPVRRRPLPAWLHDRLAAEAERLGRELAADFATGEFFIPFRSLVGREDGAAWLAPAVTDRLLSLLVPPDPSEASVAVVPTERREYRHLRDVAVEGDRLVALYETEVRWYRLRPAAGRTFSP